jgi:20S proteasome alpha/beta subunit
MLTPEGLSVEEAHARIEKALTIIYEAGQIDGHHHKMWVIDQVVRHLMGDDYEDWVAEYQGDPDDDANYYYWDEGVCP